MWQSYFIYINFMEDSSKSDMFYLHIFGVLYVCMVQVWLKSGVKHWICLLVSVASGFTLVKSDKCSVSVLQLPMGARFQKMYCNWTFIGSFQDRFLTTIFSRLFSGLGLSRE